MLDGLCLHPEDHYIPQNSVICLSDISPLLIREPLKISCLLFLFPWRKEYILDEDILDWDHLCCRFLPVYLFFFSFCGAEDGTQGHGRHVSSH